MSAVIIGFILRSKNRHITDRYYRALGLYTHEHAHGKGPLHFEVRPLTELPVVEIYEASEKYQSDALMLSVTSLEEASKLSIAYLGTGITEIIVSSTGRGRFAYVKDPDGRNVMLIEETKGHV